MCRKGAPPSKWMEAWWEKKASPPVSANEKQVYLDICAKFLSGASGVRVREEPDELRSCFFPPSTRTAFPRPAKEAFAARDAPLAAGRACYTEFESRRVLLKTCLLCGREDVTTCPEDGRGAAGTRRGRMVYVNRFAARSFACVCDECDRV